MVLLSKAERWALLRNALNKCAAVRGQDGQGEAILTAVQAAESNGNVQVLVDKLAEVVGTWPDSTLLYVAVAHALPSRLCRAFQEAVAALTTGTVPRNTAAASDHTSVPVDGATGAVRDHCTELAGSSAMHAALRARVEATASVTVFLSSPFGGLEEERAFFVERYLPSLRTLCENKGVALSLVDLRWGITEEQAAQFETLRICLQEIDRCDIFVGCYGARYGTRHSSSNSSTHWVGCSVDRAMPQYPWLDKHRDKGITELEFRHGVLNDPCARPSLFLFRDPAYDAAKAELYAHDPAHKAKYINTHEDSAQLRRVLEQEIRELAWKQQHLNITATSYSAPEDAAKHMFDILHATLQQVLPREGVAQDADGQVHASFAAVRRGFYVGNRALVRQINLHLDQHSPAPLVVEGESGSGKSALLANWVHQHTSLHAHDRVFCHFTGCDSASTALRNLLSRLLVFCDPDMAESLSGMTTQQLCEALPACIASAADTARAQHAGARLVIVLDALNQLENETFPWLPQRLVHRLDWLPTTFPEGVVLVCSTLPGLCQDALRARAYDRITTAPLSRHDCKAFLEQRLRLASKTLMAAQMDVILDSPQCGNPLFLTLLIEELIAFGVFEELDSKIAELAACTNVPVLLQAVLSRLEQSFGSVGGARVIGQIFRLIGVSREGVLEQELQAACGVMSTTFAQDSRADGDGDGDAALSMSGFMWSSLYFAIRHLLVVKSGRFTFLHDYIRQAVHERYLSTEEEVRGAHAAMAKTLSQHALFLHAHRKTPKGDRGGNDGGDDNGHDTADADDSGGDAAVAVGADEVAATINVRYVGQLPFHLVRCGRLHECVSLLSDLEFVEAKCSCGLVYDLLEDFTACEAAMSASQLRQHPTGAMFKELKQMLAFNLPILSRLPGNFLPVAVNQPNASPIHDQAQQLMARRRLPHFKWINKPQSKSACIMHIEGHSNPVYCASINQHRIASGARNGELRVWDVKTGTLLNLLAAHRAPINDVCWLEDDVLATASDDGSICTWRLSTGTCASVQRAEAGAVQSLLVLRKAGLMVSAHTYSDPPLSAHSIEPQPGILCFWSLDNGTLLHKAQTKDGSPVCVCADARQQLLAVDVSGSLLGGQSAYVLYDLGHAAAVSVTERQSLPAQRTRRGAVNSRERTHRLRSCAFSADGEHLITIHGDALIKYTRAGAGSAAVFEQTCITPDGVHQGTVYSVAYGDDTIVSGGADKLVVVWNTDLTLRACLVGHAWSVFCVTLVPPLSSASSFTSTTTTTTTHSAPSNPDACNGDGDGDGGRGLIVSCAGIWDKRLMVWEIPAKASTPSSAAAIVPATATASTSAPVVGGVTGDARPPHFGEIVMGGVYTPDLQAFVSSGQNARATLQLWDVRTTTRRAMVFSPDSGDSGVLFPGSMGSAPAVLPTGEVVVASRRGKVGVFRAKTTAAALDASASNTRASTTHQHTEEQTHDVQPKQQQQQQQQQLQKQREERVAGEEWEVVTDTPAASAFGNMTSNGDILRMPGGQHYVVCDAAVRVVSIKQPAEPPQELLNGTGRIAVVSPSGRRVVITGQSRAQVWALKPPRLIKKLRNPHVPNSRLYGAAYSPDGRLIALADHARYVTVYCARTFRVLHAFRMWDRAYRCTFTPDARMVLCGGDDKTVGLWDAISGVEVARCYVGAGVGTVSIGPGLRVVAGDDLGRVNFLDLVNCGVGVPVVTATYEWDADANAWSAEPLITCPHTGKRFPLPADNSNPKWLGIQWLDTKWPTPHVFSAQNGVRDSWLECHG
ncbi:hypothetical protein PTSG_01838 [Salpingoeca rosetta]|uniref:Uncharacterized protein n=1 Tax=Salpingoeca rosetta (strain ATCC 50818 / BSB-021) TaxID=946362 RepID=F2TZ36_SALR5|nr:uncharacterized protein PTSG_01838 [Salpingoeca rosetta]EGD78860.1 hypothetical protein PTSG_01838 [Salpingoeca rosetta]|eukprot:XP_004997816.1 hypothetical protein PTSG_01838 [Salpingoeca rosetta]